MPRSTTRFRAPFVLTLATLSAACGDSASTLNTTCPAPSTVRSGVSCSHVDTLRCRDDNSCGYPIEYACREGRWAMITQASCNPPMPDASVSD
jgi:hypothetical protein